jgi:hypothetical protein
MYKRKIKFLGNNQAWGNSARAKIDDQLSVGEEKIPQHHKSETSIPAVHIPKI